MKKANGSGVFTVFFAVAFLLVAAAAIAHEGGSEEGEIAEGKELFDSGVSCDKLGNEQLEAIGEYLMGQMHPGEAHDLMHNIMGIEEGTPYHDQFHVNLAQAMYCDTATGGTDAAAGGSGMMGAGGMMPMMRMMPMMNAMAGQGMMPGRTGFSGYGWYAPSNWNLFTALYLVLLIGLVGLVYFWLIRLWRESKSGGRRKHGK